MRRLRVIQARGECVDDELELECRTAAVSNTVALPNTPAGAQIKWLIGATEHLPIPSGAVRAHFDAAVLAENPSAKINENTTIPVLLAAIKGAFTLAARG